MKNVLIAVLLVASWLLVMWAMFAQQPYDAKIYVAFIGIVGIMTSALLTMLPDNRR